MRACDYARARARGRERPHQYRAAASESSLRLAVASELRRSRRSGRNQEKKVMLPHYQYSYNVPGSRSGIKICRVIFLLVIILTRRPCLRLTLRSTCTVFDLEMTTYSVTSISFGAAAAGAGAATGCRRCLGLSADSPQTGDVQLRDQLCQFDIYPRGDPYAILETSLRLYHGMPSWTS